MSPHQARGRARSLTGARGARVAHGARGDRDEGDNDNHHESVMGEEPMLLAKTFWVVGGAPPTVISGTEFMQGVFTAIEQVVRNTVQEMLVPARPADTRVTIREDLNETRWITHPKSQREGTSAQPEGHFLKKPKSSMLLDQTSRRGPICFGCHQSGHRVTCCPLKGQKRAVETGGYSRGQAQEQSQVRKPPTCFHCGQVGHIARQCTHRRNTMGASEPQALGQMGQRTRGRTYAMTSVAGPSETMGQQEQQLDASVVRVIGMTNG
ncbi:hypothetical protein Acr_19g0007210 [Actinidia rufa]|uniref:CCHC-type domain-containing protein n=1 Tax=Actinidia rufa TaxID=165716 RepID=A0A7J0GAF9_9ERIC|nr:hypothetical protein Acr_19g0007210 [Actinidia rufa]